MFDPQRWRRPLAGLFATLTLTSIWWIGPFMAWLEGHTNQVQGLDSFIQTNQGIRMSLRNGLRLGLIGVPMFLSAAWLAALVLPGDGAFARLDWRGLPTLIVGGFAGGFILTGGLAALTHYGLRLSLALQGRLPLNLVPFLDHATRLICLAPAGGGWVFIHRLLQEHLAAQAAAAAPRR